MTLDQHLDATLDERMSVFRNLVRDVPYERKGIPNSEMFFLWLLAGKVNPRRVLESGRARGQSTLILARCFPDAEIISVEHDKSSPDVAVAAERLRGESNVRLLFGDATRILPELAKPGDIALIDGPKGFRGVRFALSLLQTGKLPMVFVHDVGPTSPERAFFSCLGRNAEYSDAPDLVRHTHNLDDEEAMDFPAANRFHAVAGRSGYGYGLACLHHDQRKSYRGLRWRAALAGISRHMG